MGINQPRLTSQTLKVLAALLSQSQTRTGTSGAEIARSTKLPSGTLYPILMRLEDAGWVESCWETGDPRQLGRPRRRLYQITGFGVKKTLSAYRELVLPFKEFAWS